MPSAVLTSPVSRGPWRALLLVTGFLLVTLTPSRAHAYAWMIRHSYTGCPVCHADPSGGETLTAYGRAQSDLLLRMRWDGKKSEEAEPSSASGFLGFINLPEPLLLGGSLRMASVVKKGGTRVFPMQMDLYGQLRVGSFFAGGSVGAARVDVGSPYARAAQVTTNQGKEFNVISRSHYIGMDFADATYTARVGRLNLPFGLRIPEHTAWVRSSTRTDRESAQQHGVALAYNSDTLRGEGMVILGNYQINPDKYRERGYSFYVELMVGARGALGVSSLYTYSKVDRVTLAPNVARGAHGLFTRFAVGEPFVLLAEGDLLTDSSRTLGYTGFVQGDYEIVQGLHAMLTGELLDSGQLKKDKALGTPTSDTIGKAGIGGWVSLNWFFMPHFDLRVDLIRHPKETSLLSQLHAFL